MYKNGLMMDPPLLISSILEHAALQWGASVIASRECDGTTFHYTYSDLALRTKQLANAMHEMHFGESAAVATIASNTHRHLEVYYAVSGSGYILHTCNPRLPVEQLAYIIDHAEDQLVFFDPQFAPVVVQLIPRCPNVRHWVCLADRQRAPTLNMTQIAYYEDLIANKPSRFQWPIFDEQTAAALCYTSGTTGNPKGVLFSHRSIVLNAISIGAGGVLAISQRECLMPIVPMFHVNGWCIPYAALVGGAKLVLPGSLLDPASLYELLQQEGVTCSAAVPTIWALLRNHLSANGLKLSGPIRIVSGGSAIPMALVSSYQDELGVEVRQGWGMTETVAVATISALDAQQQQLPSSEQSRIVSRQGKSIFGVEIKVVDENGTTLARDGESQGEVMIRGQWVASAYYKSRDSALRDGWFPTGDIGTIDQSGVLCIKDRAKDLIKTGGEWISSLDLENVASSHPAVASVAVIGVPHPKWMERPLMLVVPRPASTCDRETILSYLSERVPGWWLPEDIIFVDSLPLGSTGKVQKTILREQYGNVFS